MEKEWSRVYWDWEWSHLEQFGPGNICGVELCKIWFPEDYRYQNWQDLHRNF